MILIAGKTNKHVLRRVRRRCGRRLSRGTRLLWERRILRVSKPNRFGACEPGLLQLTVFPITHSYKRSTIAPSIGPILGGSLSYSAGWTWIFWFLSIAAGVCLVLVVLFLPETSRKIVGNGSVRPPKHLTLPVRCVFRHWKEDHVAIKRGRWPNPLRSSAMLLRRDNAVITLACGLLYAVYTCVNASLSVLFVDIYHLNQW